MTTNSERFQKAIKDSVELEKIIQKLVNRELDRLKLTCPYCGWRHEPEACADHNNDEESFECHSCAGLFDYTVDHVTYFETTERFDLG